MAVKLKEAIFSADSLPERRFAGKGVKAVRHALILFAETTKDCQLILITDTGSKIRLTRKKFDFYIDIHP